MTENHPGPIERSPTTYADWPTLIERAVDNISQILRVEVHILQTSIGTSLETQISNAVAYLKILVVLISGAICVLCASILLLHQWLPWWQAFGIVGVALLVIGIMANAAMRASSEATT